jgi:uncharacterized protein
VSEAVEHVLLIGVSTRAAAESAARAGFAVTAIDAFADLDQYPGIRAITPAGPFGPRAAVKIGRTVACTAVAYLSMFENYPDEVTAFAAGRTLWGNSADVLRRVRNPECVAAALSAAGMPVAALGGDDRRAWLSKPLASGGGVDIRTWRPTMRASRTRYVQERIDGVPASVVFCAANRRAEIIGVSRQLVGLHQFGAEGFRYCGSILDPALAADFAEQLQGIVHVITESFDLAGVNGIDFIVRQGEAVPIEVNPRWCSSMELVERAYGLSVFGSHAAACQGQHLPGFDVIAASRGIPVFGKAIVFAREDVTIQDTRAWLRDQTVRDVPREGDRIAAGRPVCTVFATGTDPDECQSNLERRAAQVYELLTEWEKVRR